MADKRLRKYQDKRDFRRTSEPDGARVPPAGAAPRFVIQHHDASTEHYDFRLEADGVLLSWAVPKGPSTDPSDKRLAVRTEDHPVDYLDFEGVIPAGEYGGGTVLVWDIGTWENLSTNDSGERLAVADALKAGHLSFRIEGKKLSGGYTLHRFRDEQDQWLLIKQKDAEADARRRPVSTETESVLSGRSLKEVAGESARRKDRKS